MKKYLDLLRVHHWLKNFYIFIPLFFNKELSINNLIYLIEIFIIFSLSASTIYIFNDLIDYDSDKKNPWKKSRPIASDLFSKKDSIFIISILLIILIFLLYFFQTSKFVIYLVSIYVVINIFYSLLLKKIFILNYLVLVSFFYIRLIAGTIENKIPLSNWLTVFILTSSLILIIGKKLSDFTYSDKLNNKKKILIAFITFVTVFQLIIYIIFVNTDYALTKYGNLFQYSSLFVFLGTIRYLLLIKKGSVTSDQINLFLKDKILIFSTLAYLIYLSLIFY